MFLLCLSFLVNVKAQNNPCPDIQDITLEVVTFSPNCSAFVRVLATGDVSAPKSMNVKVYLGLDASAPLISDSCHIVPENTPSTAYDSEVLNVPCNSNFTVVITRRTSSNGECGGGECGNTITVRGPFGGILPVSLSSFTAKRDNSLVTLDWTAESESNLKEYQVEINSGLGFTPVKTVAAKNSGISNSYNVISNFSSKQSVQYRLKMVDNDGKFVYSQVVLVKGEDQNFDFSIFPNPGSSFDTKVLISGLVKTGRIQVMDMSGRVVKNLVINSSSISLGTLPTGVFMVKLIDAITAEVVTKRLVIVN